MLPAEIEIVLYSTAHADEPPATEVVATLISDPIATTAGPELPARQITVGVLPVWGVALGWVLAIVLASQAAKSCFKAIGLKEQHPTFTLWPPAIRWRKTQRHTWRRWLYVVPIVLGIALSLLFGPALGELFGLKFGVWTSLLFLGPGSGATAAFAYDLGRNVILPILPSAVIGIIERLTGLTIPVKVKSNVKWDNADAESEVYDDDSEPITVPLDPSGL